MQLVLLKKVLAVSLQQSCVSYLLSSNTCVCARACVCVCVCVCHTGHADSGTKESSCSESAAILCLSHTQ